MRPIPSLTDFAADLRAPTPTAAAELAVPVRGELLAQVQRARRPRRALRPARARTRAGAAAGCLRAWPERESLLSPQQQRLDELGERLPRALRGRLDRARGELGRAGGALRPGLAQYGACARARAARRALWRVAELAHPNRPLEKGYARIEDRGRPDLDLGGGGARVRGRLRLIFR